MTALKRFYWPNLEDTSDPLALTGQRAMSAFCLLAGFSGLMVFASNLQYIDSYFVSVLATGVVSIICFLAPIIVNFNANYKGRTRAISYLILGLLISLSIKNGHLISPANLLQLPLMMTLTLAVGWRDGAAALLGNTLSLLLSFIIVAPIDAQPEYSSHLIALIMCSVFGFVGPAIFRQEMEKSIALSLDAARIAEEANQTKSNFLTAMSHEIRTPLNGVIAMSQLLSKSELAAEDKRLNEFVMASADALKQHLDDILDLSSIESGRMQVHSETFSVAHLISVVENSAAALAAAKGLRLKTKIDANVPAALIGDRPKISQILQHFVSNAVTYTEAGTIEISVLKGACGHIEFIVADTGTGMGPELQGAIFNRFEKTANTKEAIGESGFGLVLSKELATLIEGEITFQSTLGKGSSFWLRLPLQTGDADLVSDIAQGRAQSVKKVNSDPLDQLLSELVDDVDPTEIGPRTPKKTEPITVSPEIKAALDVSKIADSEIDRADDRIYILLAEDNAVNQMIIRKIIQQDPRLRLEIVPDGQACLDALAEREFDLILMDVHMPRLTGDEALERIRQSTGPAADIPIVMLTASVLEEQRRKSMSLGATDFLTKPVNVDELFNTIIKTLSNSSALSQ